MAKIMHSKKHNIDSAADHTGVSGATQGNVVSFDTNGLIEDSGVIASDLSSHLTAANPHSGSAASGANGDITSFTSLTGDMSDGTNTVTISKLSGALKGEIIVTFDGGGSVLTTGAKKVYIPIPYDGTINAVRLLADQTGSVTVDIWKDTYAAFPPTVADSITASSKPAITSAQKSEDTTLTGWTTSITAGDILEFNIDSVSAITKLILILDIDKTGA